MFLGNLGVSRAGLRLRVARIAFLVTTVVTGAMTFSGQGHAGEFGDPMAAFATPEFAGFAQDAPENVDLLPLGAVPARFGPRSGIAFAEIVIMSQTGEPMAIELDPIVVQGEKFARDKFETYTSVGVLTEADIYDYNFQTLGDGLNALANVRAFPSGAGDGSFTIRGLNGEGVTQPSRSAPIVSVIVDGVGLNVEAMRRGSRGLWDVDQLEVLRGPQSTIRGQNALGGAIVVETRDPTWEPEIIVEGELGSMEHGSAAFAFSGPIIEDQLAFRLSGQLFRETKDITYADPAIAALGEDEFEELRAKLLFEPAAQPDLSMLFTVSYTHDKPGWNLVSGPNYFDRTFVDSGGSTAEFRDTTSMRYIADVNYDLGPNLTLTSITALSDTEVTIESSPASTLNRSDTRDGLDISQDLRLTFGSAESVFSGVVGLFAGRFDTDIESYIDTNQLAGFGIPNAIVQDLTAENRTTSFAAYADLRWRFADQWTLLAGGRVLRDKVSSDYDGQALDIDATFARIAECAVLGCVPNAIYGSLAEKTSTTNIVALPKIGIAFDVTPDDTLAFTVSRGYRAGFSETIAGSTTINEIDPEYLWSYELAYRSRWLDGQLDFDANAFYYDYDNQQIVTFNPAFPGQTITLNSGRSHAYGAEVDIRYRPIDELELFTSVGLLQTKFDQAVTTVGNIAGNEFPEAPAVTAALGGIWRHESGFFAGADVSYTGSYYSSGDLANTDLRQVDAFTLVNAQIGYEIENFYFAIYAKNMFDEDYLTSIGDGGTYATVGEGRSIGGLVNVRF